MTPFVPTRLLYIRLDQSETALQQKLEDAGYIIDVASASQVGRTLYQKMTYDIVLFDLPRSEIPTAEKILPLLTILEASTATIIVAEPGHEHIVAEAMRLGVDNYIIKDEAGGYLELLIRIIEKALQQRQLVQPKQEAEVRQILARVERAKQEWETTIDSLSHLVCLLDRQACIIRANRTLERWGLAQVTEVRGRRFQDLLQVGADWVEAWSSVSQGRAVEFEIEEASLNRYLSIQVRPLSRQTYRRERLTESFAVVVVEDVTRRKQAEEALRHHAAELQERNDELDAFAHTVAHDLQNPLGLIIGFAAALNKHQAVLTAEETIIYLRKIMETGQKMSSIIYELLLLASVRQQEVQLAPLDMAKLVSEAQNRLTLLIEDYQAEIIVPQEWPIVWGYSPWIEEVWVNYISNGIKYGGSPPRLVLGASPAGELMVRFWIRDNGPGLTKKQQRQLFRPFIRLHRKRAGGHGLGLSIVQRIITKLGGQVTVESAGIPGQGATFSFTLPRLEEAMDLRSER